MKISPLRFPKLHKISGYDDFQGSQETAKMNWIEQSSIQKTDLLTNMVQWHNEIIGDQLYFGQDLRFLILLFLISFSNSVVPVHGTGK